MIAAGAAVQAAVIGVLRARDGFAVTGIHDGVPARARFPYAAVEETGAVDWSHKGLVGREVRIALMLWDEAGQGARLHALFGEAEAAIAELPRELSGGWRVASVAFVRSRIVRDAARPWAGLIEHRVRVAAPSTEVEP